MPPKKIDASTNGASAILSQADIDYLVTVLKSVEGFSPDWRTIAPAVGIARADNAGTKFQNILKKMGMKLVKGKFVALDDAAAQPTAQPKIISSKGRKRKATFTPADAATDDEHIDKKAKPESDDDDE